jgi:hypothetical protein
MGREVDAVIAHEDGRGNQAGTAGEDEVERQPRLARTGRAANEDGAISHPHG